jgi:hypothetical protein
LTSIQSSYRRLGIDQDILTSNVIITADTGFANETNNQYLKAAKINAYIPDNQFRSRDPKFKHQKDKYGKRHQDTVKGEKRVIPASEFNLNVVKRTCRCPAGNQMWLHNESVDKCQRQLETVAASSYTCE